MSVNPSFLRGLYLDNGYNFKGACMKALRFDSSWITMYVLLVQMVERELLKTCSLTLTQYRIMFTLTQGHNAQRIGTIAKIIDLKPSSVTEAVNQLIARDLVSRDYDDAEDRRAVHVRLKKTGVNLLEEADKALVALILDVWGSEYDTETRRRIFEQSAKSVISQGQVRVENRTIRADTAYIISVLIGYSNAVAHAHEFGLSLSQYRILLRLSEIGEVLSCADVSRDLLMKSNAVSVACDVLVEKELIERERAEDRRYVLLELTKLGKTTAGKITREISQGRAQRSQVSTVEENELFLSLASSIVDRLRLRVL
jgi:DNA-binding MarR family transcriptional regulator